VLIASRHVLHLSYEMQVSSRAQGAGLGRSLMNEVELLAQGAWLTKIVLTCLKRKPFLSVEMTSPVDKRRCIAGNVLGLRFYQKFG
jgi:GNAT superfamily N-acetyltransferase